MQLMKQTWMKTVPWVLLLLDATVSGQDVGAAVSQRRIGLHR